MLFCNVLVLSVYICYHCFWSSLDLDPCGLFFYEDLLDYTVVVQFWVNFFSVPRFSATSISTPTVSYIYTSLSALFILIKTLIYVLSCVCIVVKFMHIFQFFESFIITNQEDHRVKSKPFCNLCVPEWWTDTLLLFLRHTELLEDNDRWVITSTFEYPFLYFVEGPRGVDGLGDNAKNILLDETKDVCSG